MNDPRLTAWFRRHRVVAMAVGVAAGGYYAMVAVGHALEDWRDHALPVPFAVGVVWACVVVVGIRRHPRSLWWWLAVVPVFLGGPQRHGFRSAPWMEVFFLGFIAVAVPAGAFFGIRAWRRRRSAHSVGAGLVHERTSDAAETEVYEARREAVVLLLLGPVLTIAALGYSGYRVWHARQQEKERRELLTLLHREAAGWSTYYGAELAPPTQARGVTPTSNVVGDAARKTLRNGFDASEFFDSAKGGTVEIEADVDTPAHVVSVVTDVVDTAAMQTKGFAIAGVRVSERFAADDASVTYVRFPGYMLPGAPRDPRTAAAGTDLLTPRWVAFDLAPQTFAQIEAPGLVGRATATGRLSPLALVDALRGARITVELGRTQNGTRYSAAFVLDDREVNADVTVRGDGTLARLRSPQLTPDCRDFDVRIRQRADARAPALPPGRGIANARSLRPVTT